MAQSHYQIGSSLGQALGGAFSDDAYNKGRSAGLTHAKTEAEARLAQRQNDLQSDDNILATALQGAGISSADMPKFKNYMTHGTVSEPARPQTGIDIQSILGGALKNSATTGGEDYSAFIEPKPVAIAPDMTPQQRQQYDMAMRSIAAMRQALMQGDKSTTNATGTALANLRASGAGNNDTTLAQLLLHGKPQFYGQTTGSTDALTGAQVLNDIGRSQINENIAQAGNANANAAKTKRELDNPTKYNLQLGEVTKLFSKPALESDGSPVIDMRTMMPVQITDQERVTEFIKFMKDNGYTNSDQALVEFMTQPDANPVVNPKDVKNRPPIGSFFK